MKFDPQTTTLTVPDETREKFGEWVDMIIGSDSMNDEERQYWVDVLPIMTEEQLDNLREILANEKRQLEETSKTYEGMEEKAGKSEMAFDEAKYKTKKEERVKAEHRFEEEESEQEARLLEEISNM